MFTIFTAEAGLTDSSSTDVPLVDYLAELDGSDWRVASTQVSWFFRKEGRDTDRMDHVALKILEAVDARYEWDRLRGAVNAKRRAIHRARSDEHVRRQKDKRRTYMREYMAMYRKRLR